MSEPVSYPEVKMVDPRLSPTQGERPGVRPRKVRRESTPTACK